MGRNETHGNAAFLSLVGGLVQRLSDVALGRLGVRDLSLAIRESANLGLIS
jgi:hypothetical protein